MALDEKDCVFSWLVTMGEYKRGLYGLGKGMGSGGFSLY